MLQVNKTFTVIWMIHNHYGQYILVVLHGPPPSPPQLLSTRPLHPPPRLQFVAVRIRAVYTETINRFTETINWLSETARSLYRYVSLLLLTFSIVGYTCAKGSLEYPCMENNTYFQYDFLVTSPSYSLTKNKRGKIWRLL